MRAYDNGCFYSVSVSSDEVRKFRVSWPCSGMPIRPIWFQFDKRNDDLVDILPNDLEEHGTDGSALVAMSHDAQAYGKKSLKL